jgi:uncharacterized protein
LCIEFLLPVDCGSPVGARRDFVVSIGDREVGQAKRGSSLAMDHCEIAVRVQPRAGANEIVGERAGVLVVRVTAAPTGGQANAALCRLIAKRARVGVRRVSIVRGAGGREKRIRVEGIGERELRKALGGDR